MRVIVGKTNSNSEEAISEEIKNMAKEVELIIIVGDKKNKRVNQMYDISLKECGNAMLVETMEDLYVNYVRRFRTVGILPDTLTTQNQIETIVNVLEHTQVEGYIYEHFK